jgi:tetratricopeptide (TPR) repeat protein
MKLVVLALSLLLASSRIGAQATSGPGGTFGNAAPPSPGINTGGANPSSTIGPSAGSIYLYGRVTMDDGSELPLNVVIEKICNGRTTALTYADRKGRFAVSLAGDSTAKFADASYDSRSVGSPNQGLGMQTVRKPSLVGCDLRASYPGFQSDHVNISSSRAMDDPNLGTFILHKQGGAAPSTISETFRTAPRDAVKAYERGMDDLRKGKAGDAGQQFQKAVDQDAQFASAWYELGRLKMPEDAPGAQTLLRKAVAADPKYAPPYVELSFLAIRAHDWPSAIDLTTRALALDSSSYPQLFYFSAIAYANAGNYDEAEKKARDAVRVDHDRRFPKAMQLLGFLLERKGDIAGAAEQMRGYLATEPPADDAKMAKTQLASLETRIKAISK